MLIAYDPAVSIAGNRLLSGALHALALGLLASSCNDDASDHVDPAAVIDSCESATGMDIPFLAAADFDLSFCEGRQDCFRTDASPVGIGCPSTCACLCYDEVVYVIGCTWMPGCEETICH